jgi:pantothenate kinase-related protein Tda10
MEVIYLYTAINDIYSQRNNFIIVGLTGRVGSGCSTVADYMSLKKDKLNVIEATLGDNPRRLPRRSRLHPTQNVECRRDPYGLP